jgi:aminopeptidase N
VDSVGLSGTAFTHQNDTLRIQLNQTYSPGSILQVKIWYHHKAVTDQAFYVNNGFVFTDFPPEGARKVFPCWDRPADKATWDLTAKVPISVRLGSTGTLADSTILADTLWYHWISEDPVSTYLITWTSYTNWNINISYWNSIYNPSDSIPIWLYKKPTENITNAVEKIPLMTDFFAERFGEYPFSKIGFATITTFPWAGMENQTMVNLKPNGYGDEPLIAHEHSHMWFGDLITCGTWADIWLNEGFATYCAQLWLENQSGYTSYKNKMNSLANYYLSNNPGWPIYNPLWAIQTPSSNALYNLAVSYNKGACVHHQLRYVLGDSLYFAVMNSYATDTGLVYGCAVTDDFIATVNEVTSQDYSWFFDEWIFSPNHPYYDNVWEREDLGNGEFKVTLSVDQIQTNTVFFRMPVEVRIDFNDGSDTLIQVWNEVNPQTFEWIFQKYPEQVIFDPYRNILLKEGTTVAGKEEKESVSFRLFQNTPNPFRQTTRLAYWLNSRLETRICLLDQSGNELLAVSHGFQEAGEHQINLDLSNYSAGVYFCRMEAGGETALIKMVLIR